MYSCSYPINNNYSTTYYPTNDYNFSNNRIIPGAGGFLLPFSLGFLTAPLVYPPRPPFYGPRPPFYGPRPPFYGPRPYF